MVNPAPLSPDLPLPHRKVIRSWLSPMTEARTFKAILLLVLDAVLWLSLI
ncbi:MAG: fatty acid desaturase, partial [Burkholderiaceae bacterium]|nr:fatty acid desaturase [Burkholderiaceae bacterium]